MWECFAETATGLRGKLVRIMLLGCDRIVVYSRRLRDVQAKLHGVDSSTFVFIPYKANHSKKSPIETRIGDYVFAGGNSSRDYDTLFRAIKGTGIPLIVSTTRPDIL